MLIAIPAYGGQLLVQCFTSVLKLYKSEEILSKYDLSVLTIHNEALISRARQEMAKEAINREVDYLFFIDADTSFTPTQFLKVLDADKPVVGGTYMKKTLVDPGLNFSISLEIDKLFWERHQTLPSSLHGFDILRRDHCSEGPILKAKYIPTGFMCIKVDILKKLSENTITYLSDTRGNDQPSFTEEEIKKMQVAELFPVSVQNNRLESEDWGFCRLCSENDIGVFLHTDVVVEHHGAIVFHPQHFKMS